LPLCAARGRERELRAVEFPKVVRSLASDAMGFDVMLEIMVVLLADLEVVQMHRVFSVVIGDHNYDVDATALLVDLSRGTSGRHRTCTF